MQNHASLQYKLQVDCIPLLNHLYHVGANRVNSCNAAPCLAFSSTVFHSKTSKHVYALQLSVLQADSWIGMLITFSYYVHTCSVLPYS